VAIRSEPRSLAELAASAPPRLVLQSPFSSARDVATSVRSRVSVFWGLISRVHFDTNARVAALDVPVSVAHGDKDLIIPAEMGREVFAAARRPGELLIVPGAGHNDVPEVGRRTYWTWLVRAVHAGDLSSGTRDAPTRTRSAP
jgi:fermentation-respiration switch protein FrsA (DUF1100 family)